MSRSRMCLLGFIGILGVFAGAPDGWTAGERQPTYVWLFDAQGAEAEALVDTVTEEFEEALVSAGCLPIVERRNLPELEAHQRQEKRIAGADYLSPGQRRLLSTATADAVVFGKITDDLQGGQIKVAATLQTLSGVTLASASVRIIRGKRFDAEEREHRMQELAWDICGALGFTRADSGPKADHSASRSGDGPGGDRDAAPNPGPFTETKNGVTVEILGCQYSARRVTCSGTMTQNAGGYNHIVGGSDGTYLWDTQSNQYPLTRVRLGAKEGWRADGDLPAGVPTRFDLTFEAIPDGLREVKALLIATYQQKFQFENIPLTR